MKKPTISGWIAIVGALVALILAAVAAFSDGVFTPAEAKDLSDKSGALIEAVQQATDDDATEAQP